MKQFDDYEICPIAILPDGSPENMEGQDYNDEDISYWTLFGHLPGEGLVPINDYILVSDAIFIYESITGRAYK